MTVAAAVPTDAEIWADLPPVERAVIRFHDPAADLEERCARWNHEPAGHDLPALVRFGAGLARAEADAWQTDQPHIATRARSDRRFFLGDRILHWGVPWLDVVGRCYPDARETAHRGRDALLDLGELLRPAPAFTGGEGLTLPGHDGYGPTHVDLPLEERLLSLWSGALLLRATIRSMGGGPDRAIALDDANFRALLGDLYRVWAVRWARLAADQPGSAQLWLDLSTRAGRTTAELLPTG